MSDWINTESSRCTERWGQLQLPQPGAGRTARTAEWLNLASGAALLLLPDDYRTGHRIRLLYLAPQATSPADCSVLLGPVYGGEFTTGDEQDQLDLFEACVRFMDAVLRAARPAQALYGGSIHPINGVD